MLVLIMFRCFPEAFSESPLAIKRRMLQISQKNLQVVLPKKVIKDSRYTRRSTLVKSTKNSLSLLLLEVGSRSMDKRRDFGIKIFVYFPNETNQPDAIYAFTPPDSKICFKA